MTDQTAPSIQTKSAPEFRGSLARTVVIGLLIISLIPVLIIGFATYLRTRTTMLEQAKVQIDTISQTYTNQLSNLAASRTKALNELNGQPNFDENILTINKGTGTPGYYQASRNITDYLNSYISTPTEEIFNQLSIITSDGTVIASTNSDLIGKLLTQETFLMTLYQTNQNVLVLNPGGLFPNQLVLVTTKLYRNPLGGPGLTFIGFSTPTLLTDTLRTSQSLFANSSAYFITTNKQYAAYNPVQSTVSQVTFNKTFQTLIENYVNQSGSGTSFAYTNQNAIPVVSEIRKISDVKSTLVIEVPDKSVYGLLSSMLPFIGILLAGSLAITGLIIGLGARSIVVPLVDLAKHAREFSSGDWSFRVDVKRRDEIGLLGYSFNVMVQQLTDFYHSLEARVEERTHQMRQATEIAQEAVTATTQNEILQRAVKMIGEKFGFQMASIYLMDESGKLVVLAEQYTRDPSKRLEDFTRIAVENETLVGWVAKNNQPRLEERLPLTKTPAQLMHVLPETQSELVIPLVMGNTVAGVLDIQSDTPGSFDSESVTIFTSLGSQISAGLRNIQMVESSTVNLQQATSLYRSTRQISKAQSKDEVTSLITELFSQTNYVCFFMDVEHDQLRLVNLTDPKGTRLDQSLKGFTVPFARGIHKLAEGINIYIENLEGESEFANLNSYFSRRGCKSSALIPVMEGTELSHIIALGSRDRIAIAPMQIQPLTTAGEVIGSALERIRLEETLEQRAKELSTLGAISKTTSNEADLPGLLSRLHNELKAALGSDVGFALALHRPDLEKVEIPYYIDEKEIECEPYTITNDLFSTIINKGEPILLSETSILGFRTIDSPNLTLTTQSFLGVPLKLADEVIGAMALLDSQHPNRFTLSDQDLLVTIAPQASTNIRNVELLTSQTEALKAYDQERFLLNSLLDHTPDRVEFKNTEGQTIRASQASANPAEHLQPATESQSAVEGEFVRDEDQEMMESGTSIIGDVEKFIAPDGNERWELVSKIPLRDDAGNINGLLKIGRDITDLKSTEQLAERRASQLLTASEIARDTSSGSQNINELLRRLVDLVRSRFGFYHSSIFLLDPLGQFAVLKESTGEAGEALKQKGHKLAVGSQSIIGQTTLLGEPVVVNDVTAAENYYPNPMLPETKSELGIPLINSGQVIGALDVQSIKRDAFSSEDVRILQVLSDQLAVAIQNSELFTKTESSLSRHRLLHQITSIASKTSTVDDAIRAAVETLHMTMAQDQITYWLPLSSGKLIVKAYAGLPRIEIASTILNLGERTVGLVAEEKRPIRLNEPAEDPAKLPVNLETKSLLTVPVIYQDKVMGVLNVENMEVAAYDETDQEILTTLANNLASIFANIQLVDQVRSQVERQRQLYDITSKIRRSVDIETIMQTSVAEICGALNIKRASIEITGGVEKGNGSHLATTEKEKEQKK